MRRILTLAFFCCLAAAPFGVGSPIDGTSAESQAVRGSEPWRKTKHFRGGERACVVAIGDVDSQPVNLEVAVYDSKNVLVASDKATSPVAGDFVCVIWYPPRDGEYRIEVTNPASSLAKCWIAIK